MLRISSVAKAMHTAQPTKLDALQRYVDINEEDDHSETPSEAEMRVLGAARSSTVTRVTTGVGAGAHHHHHYAVELAQDCIRASRVDSWRRSVVGEGGYCPPSGPSGIPPADHPLQAQQQEPNPECLMGHRGSSPGLRPSDRQGEAGAPPLAPRSVSHRELVAKLESEEDLLAVESDESDMLALMLAPPDASAMLTERHLQVRDAREVKTWLAVRRSKRPMSLNVAKAHGSIATSVVCEPPVKCTISDDVQLV